MITTGQKIRERRIALGITQDALAKAAGYHSRSTINKIESGERNLSFNKITALAEALDVTPDYLLGVSAQPITEAETSIGTAIYQACGELKKKELKQLIRYAKDNHIGRKNR